jgi:hypothetical protein
MQPGSSGTSATNASSSSLQKMMISYLFSTLALPKIISKNSSPNLLYLVGLGLRAISLKVNLLFDTSLTEYVVTSASPFDETERP